MTRYTIPTTATELDALNTDIRSAQNHAVALGIELHQQYKKSRELFTGDTTGTHALKIFKDSEQMTPTPECEVETLTSESITINPPITQEMLDTGMALAGTYVKTCIEKSFIARNNLLSNKDLAQRFEKTDISRFEKTDLSRWEKDLIEGLLIDRHEEETTQEEHDAILEQEDPVAAIVTKYRS